MRRSIAVAAGDCADAFCGAVSLDGCATSRVDLHSIYHRPNGWDHVPAGRKIPCGESSMWGDYHGLELALLLKRELNKEPYITFFDQT